MPNWACNRIVAYGDKQQVESLAKTLNTMPNLENGFGKHWMGNFVAAVTGMTMEQICESPEVSCRGTFDTNFHAGACLCGPYNDDNEKFVVDEDGRLRFSTTSAWDRCDYVEDLILEKFPGIALAWSCTDEFGNFHTTHNPEKFRDLDIISFDGDQYSYNEVGDLKSRLKEVCNGLVFDEDADIDYFLSEEFRKLYEEWSEDTKSCTDEDGEIFYIPSFEIYDED